MTEQAPSESRRFLSFIKPIFSKWEILRIPYNLILLAALVHTYVSMVGWQRPHLILLVGWIMGAACANLLFLAGPAVEAYATWLGLRSRLVTIVLFTGGALISIILVRFSTFTFFPIMMN